MKWFKHDSDAHRDAKLRKVVMKYGMEGYGLYWHCIEMIVNNISSDNLTFELEHDSEIISHDTGIHQDRVQEMMTFMVDLGLFENSDGTITCLKIAKRLDQSMTSNTQMRKLIEEIRESHDTVMTESCKTRLDKTRLEETRTNNVTENKFSDDDLSLAKEMHQTLLVINPKQKEPNFTKWADTIRLMRERDAKPLSEIRSLWRWANNHDFWRTNILSPTTLRKQWDKLTIQKNSSKQKSSDNDIFAGAI